MNTLSKDTKQIKHNCFLLIINLLTKSLEKKTFKVPSPLQYFDTSLPRVILLLKLPRSPQTPNSIHQLKAANQKLRYTFLIPD